MLRTERSYPQTCWILGATTSAFARWRPAPPDAFKTGGVDEDRDHVNNAAERGMISGEGF